MVRSRDFDSLSSGSNPDAPATRTIIINNRCLLLNA